MADEILIKAEGVSKKFCKSLKKALWYGVEDLTSEILGRNRSQENLRTKEFWAVNDVSFELRRGECLGLVGRNGAGKTTMLRMLNGLIKPDRGRITMRGRVGALIALGAGFNPILSGRENIHINASVLGLTKKEVDSKIDEIIDFSGVGDFIEAPVQSYSSGMQVRLGFAVATTLHPDILLLDEILAVGDASFVQKCIARVTSILDSGTACIFVSHNPAFLMSLTTRSLLFDKGQTVMDAPTPDVLFEYNKRNAKSLAKVDVKQRSFDNDDSRILGFELVDDREGYFDSGEDIRIRVDFTVGQETQGLRLAFLISADDGTPVCAHYAEPFQGNPVPTKSRMSAIVAIGGVVLLPGEYFLSVGLGIGNPFGVRREIAHAQGLRFRVSSKYKGRTLVTIDHKVGHMLNFNCQVESLQSV